uniref:ATP synthase complex subunit 8 n=1 Tax=Coleoptera sp. 22 KM-2017 TaxID=2219326 RepID=A0A346RIW6_9COLE|nr:ATP synthase F0 subunit 8 [Coleoptera sp. 22 KM-2017]
MPQMNPLLWFNLFIYFSLTLLIMCAYMYFTFKFNMSIKSINTLPKTSYLWKW